MENRETAHDSRFPILDSLFPSPLANPHEPDIPRPPGTQREPHHFALAIPLEGQLPAADGKLVSLDRLQRPPRAEPSADLERVARHLQPEGGIQLVAHVGPGE